MSGLQIRPADLAKLGQLALDRGKWNGRQLIAESWFDVALRPGQDSVPTYGLLWWLMGDLRFVVDEGQLGALTAKGVGAAFIAKARAAEGRYENGPDYEAALQRAFGAAWRDEIFSTLGPLGVSLSRKELTRIRGYYAEGYLGQYLIVIPEGDLVVVRMIEGTEGYDEQTDGFAGLRELALALMP